VGGIRPEVTITEPIELGNMFRNWSAKIDEKPARLKMEWRNWYDLEEVAQIINENPDDTVFELFTRKSPSAETINMITVANQEYHLLINTIKE